MYMKINLAYGLIITALMLGGCENNTSISFSGEQTSDSGTGQAMLGPLVGASVEVFLYDNMAGVPVYSGTTETSTDLNVAGTFVVTPGLLLADSLYVVRITGGEDIDADDDGVLDASPTTNNGSVHAVMTGQQLISQNYHVTFLTEVVYQNVAGLILSGSDKSVIQSRIIDEAKALISTDVSGDGVINEEDLAQWHPRTDNELLLHGRDSYQPVIDAIHSGSGVAAVVHQSIGGMLAHLITPSAPAGLHAVGSYLFSAEQADGLRIIDIATPGVPLTVGTIDTGIGDALDVYVAGNYAFVAADSDGFVIVDVSNAASPSIVSMTDTGTGVNTSALAIKVLSDKAYVVDGYAGLKIYDVSNPVSPSLLGGLSGMTWPTDIEISTGYAYVTDDADFRIIDISNPVAPSQTGLFTGDWFTALTVQGDYAYLVDGVYGMRIIDINNKTAPTQVSQFDSSNQLFDVWVDGDEVYLIEDIVGLVYLDVTDRANPVNKGASMIDANYHARLAKSGQHLYLGTFDGVGVMSDSSPGYPQVVGEIRMTLNTTPHYSFWRDVVKSGDTVFAASRGLVAIDVTNHSAPVVGNVLYIPGQSSTSVNAGGGLAFYGVLTSSSSSLNIVDVSSPLTLTPSDILATLPLESYDLVYGIDIVGNTVYLAAEVSLYIIDVSNPAIPVIDHVISNGGGKSVKVSGQHAYVAAAQSGFKVIDLSLSTPAVIATLNTGGNNMYVDLDGGYAYVGNAHGTLRVIDISSPAVPTLAVDHTISPGVRQVKVVADRLYVGHGDQDLLIFDIANPLAPMLIGTRRMTHHSTYFDYANGMLFVGDGIAGFKIINAP